MQHSSGFVRSPFTWLAYGMLAFFAYSQSTFGPILPFLRQELNLNYSLAAMHASAFALGMVFAGLCADRIAERPGVRLGFWLGGAGMAVAMLGLSVAPSAWLSISMSLFMGFAGGLLLTMIQTGLADAHPQQRAVAFLEANLLASLSMTLLPLVVGGAESIGWGWRWALWLAAAVWFIVALCCWRMAFPRRQSSELPAATSLASSTTTPSTTTPATTASSAVASATASTSLATPATAALSSLFWLYWTVLFLGVALEWCLTLWTADFLVHTGLAANQAASLLAVFTGAGIAGRLVSSRLARRIPAARLLVGMLLLVLLGFPIFWQVPLLPLRLLGLFICGFGVSGLFPLGLATTSDAVPDAPQRASAKASLAAGLAILINPQLLGIAADIWGIANAMVLVILLACAALAVLLVANRRQAAAAAVSA